MTIHVSYLQEAKRLCSMFERDDVNLAVQMERNDILRSIADSLRIANASKPSVEVQPKQVDRSYYVFDFKAEGLLAFPNDRHMVDGWNAFFEGRRRKDNRLQSGEFFARSSFRKGWDEAFDRWFNLR